MNITTHTTRHLVRFAGVALCTLAVTACAGTPGVTGGWFSKASQMMGKDMKGKKMSKKEMMSASKMQRQFTSAAGDRVHFAFDKSSLDATARRILDRQAKWLKAHSGVKIVIEGHADQRGTVEYNLALGKRRAEAVRKYLMRKGAVKAGSVRTISYGKSRLISSCTRESCHRLNRRAVVKIVGGPMMKGMDKKMMKKGMDKKKMPSTMKKGAKKNTIRLPRPDKIIVR